MLHDDIGIDPSGIMITAPDGVYYWDDPDVFRLDDTTLVYLPPDEAEYDTEIEITEKVDIFSKNAKICSIILGRGVMYIAKR